MMNNPTHEDIMTKWWKMDFNNAWRKVVRYRNGYYSFAALYGSGENQSQFEHDKTWFRERESAYIPPEVYNG